MNPRRESGIDPELGEQLSALMDGELDAERSRFLLRRMESDPRLRQAWECWQLASGSLRGHLGLQVDAGFLGRVQAGIERAGPEDEANEVVQAPPARWLRWAAGGAIAASVAVVALMGAGPGVAPPQATGESLATQSVVAPSVLSEADLRPRLRAPAQTVSAQQRGPLRAAHLPAQPIDPQLRPYLMLHDAQLQADGLGAFLPYVEAARATQGPPPRLLREEGRR